MRGGNLRVIGHNAPLPGASNAPGVRSRTFVGGPQGWGVNIRKKGVISDYNIFLYPYARNVSRTKYGFKF